MGVPAGAVKSDTAGSPVCGRGPPKLAKRPPRFRSTFPFSRAVRTASSSESSQMFSNDGFDRVSGSSVPAASSSGGSHASGCSIFWIAPT